LHQIFQSLTPEAEVVVQDFTPLIESRGHSSTSNNAEIKGKTKRGQLLVGFCNAKKEEIFKLYGSQAISKIHLFRRFILLRELLLYEYKADYVTTTTHMLCAPQDLLR
jgi:chromosome partitioning protein